MGGIVRARRCLGPPTRVAHEGLRHRLRRRGRRSESSRSGSVLEQRQQSLLFTGDVLARFVAIDEFDEGGAVGEGEHVDREGGLPVGGFVAAVGQVGVAFFES